MHCTCCGILQTLMLAKITPRQFKNSPSPYTGIPLPDVDANPLCSNIYSIGERIILAWLNQHYEQMRSRVWSAANVKGLPLKHLPSPWHVSRGHSGSLMRREHSETKVKTETRESETKTETKKTVMIPRPKSMRPRPVGSILMESKRNQYALLSNIYYISYLK